MVVCVGVVMCVLLGVVAGCAWPGGGGAKPPTSDELGAGGGLVSHRPESLELGWGIGSLRASLRGARNEWVDVVVTPSEPVSAGGELVWRLRLPLTEGGAEWVDPAEWAVRAYRVVSLPHDTRAVGWVRRAGPGAATGALPRALFPLEARVGAGAVRFVVPAGTEAVYVEWRVPLEAPAGRLAGELAWTAGRDTRRIALDLVVDDLAMTGTPDFTLVGEVAWEDLRRIWPAVLGRLQPRLVSRLDPTHIPLIERMDQVVRLARENRVDVVFPALQPTVKLTPREGLRLDWSEYDSVVMPWLRGEVAGDTPTGRDGLGGVTVLPVSDWLSAGGRPEEDVRSYWQAVVSHFDQQRMLGQTLLPAGVDLSGLGPVAEERVRRRVGVRSGEGGWVSVRGAAWEAALRTSAGQPAGAGERWAVAAGWVAPVSSGPDQTPEDPSRAAWFYPATLDSRRTLGSAVVPGLALKWARRAQQDWELIDLAYRRGGRQVVLSVLQTMLARSEAMAGVPGGDLLGISDDLTLWEQGISIIRDAAAWRDPTRTRDEAESAAWNLSEQAELKRWQVRAEVPRLLIYRSEMVQRAAGGQVALALTLTPADAGTDRQVGGWPNARLEGDVVRAEVAAETASMPVLRVEASAGPSETRFVREVALPVTQVAPVRAGSTVQLDGLLADWTEGDVVHAGGLVRMLDRRGAESGELVRSGKDTRLLMRWEPEALWVAVRVDGVAPRAGSGSTNFAREVDGRAVGEDVCRLILRTPQREIWLLLKPTGLTVERGGMGADVPVAYAAITEPVPGTATGVWRGEMRVPAELLGGRLSELQAIEMNLIRHDSQTGESASWAGPIDRDGQPLRGVILLGSK